MSVLRRLVAAFRLVFALKYLRKRLCPHSSRRGGVSGSASPLVTMVMPSLDGRASSTTTTETPAASRSDGTDYTPFGSTAIQFQRMERERTANRVGFLQPTRSS